MSFTSIEVIIPRTAQSGRLVVQTRGFSPAPTRPLLHIIRRPQIRRITPRYVAPGEEFTIVGQGFSVRDEVMLGPRSIPMTSLTPTHIIARVPRSFHPRVARVRLRRRGQAGIWAEGRLEIVTPPPVIDHITPRGGEADSLIRIHGRHFLPTDRVFWRNRPLRIDSCRSSIITAIAPRAHGEAYLTVRGQHGRFARSDTRFRVTPMLRIDVSPLSGRPGSTVTLRLSRPVQGARVLFNGRPLPKKVLHGGREIQVTVGARARTGFFSIDTGEHVYRSNMRFRVEL